ncbi:MAG: nitrile hydratase subunit beta [Candidatus Binatia bacterium]
MNGVHDLGGMDGFGPVVRERDEPVFHEPWERRVFGMVLATMGQGLYKLDEIRHAIERMSPAHYLGSTYYEHWLSGLERLLVEKGHLGAEDVTARARNLEEQEPIVAERHDPKLTAWLGQVIQLGGSSARAAGKPRFRAGDTVLVRNVNPLGHTRCPRYVRGKRGIIDRVYQPFVLPDANAHGEGEKPETVYCVRFDAAELWGSAEKTAAAVYVDLWESYLEPARRVRPARKGKTKPERGRRRKPARRTGKPRKTR